MGQGRHRAQHVSALIWAASAVLAFGACSEDASTQPGVVPVELVRLSASADTLEMGETLDSPIVVQVVGVTGEPVEGIPVRFALASGGGNVFPNLAVSNTEGLAEAEFRAGGEVGTSVIRADIASAGEVEPIVFELVTIAPQIIELAVEEGDGQTAEVESQLPLPFVVTATVGDGVPASGITIAWEIVGGGGGARLSADTTLTDEEGRAETLLTLGGALGQITVRGFAGRGTLSDTIAFAATARAALETGVLIDFVNPLPLRAGQEATIFGAGFSELREDNDVRVEGVAAEILSVSATEISFVVPPFQDRCLPERSVGVRAIVRDEASNGELVNLLPAQEPILLGVGETAFVAPADANCIQVAGDPQGAAYMVHVQNPSRAAEAPASLRLALRTPEGPELSGASELQTSPGSAQVSPALGASADIRTNALIELLRTEPGAEPARTPAGVATGQPPLVGDTLSFAFAVRPDLSVSCSAPSRTITGVVRALGEHVVVVEDVDAPTDGFSAADWSFLRDEFDRTHFPTVSSNFGAPADIDGNGRVVALFTPEVNRLIPPTGGRIDGFFLPSDLATTSGAAGGGGSACATSNESEILYLAVADPGGNVGRAVTPALARQSARRALAHELQHLVNAGQRVQRSRDFAATEEVWLDEALSHLAEELVALQLMGLGEQTGITFDQIRNERDRQEIFDLFLIPNFFRLGLYMSAADRAPVLARIDPGGTGSAQMRGFGLFLLRWLLDQQADDEGSAFVARIAGGGDAQRQGVANVEEATGRSWSDLIGEFAMTLAVDDTDLRSLDDRFTIETWNLRDIFAELNASPTSRSRFPTAYPLSIAELGFEPAAFEFDLNPSTEAFFSITGRDEAPPLALELAGRDGEVLSPVLAPQVLIARIR